MLAPSNPCAVNMCRAASRMAWRLDRSLGRPGPAGLGPAGLGPAGFGGVATGAGLRIREMGLGDIPRILDYLVLYFYYTRQSIKRPSGRGVPMSTERACNPGILKLLRGLLPAVALAAMLAGCSGGDATGERPRPVLVVQPGQGDGVSLSAYPGEVRAHEESALSFRVGGNLV